jgi:hypothetical protein
VNRAPNDEAYFYASRITAAIGSTHLVSGNSFVVSGMFTGVNAGELTY